MKYPRAIRATQGRKAYRARRASKEYKGQKETKAILEPLERKDLRAVSYTHLPGYGGIQNGYETPAPWMQSTGSVRSSGTASVGNYFTRDEVLSMSPVEVRKNLDRIKASIPKWNV